MLKLQRSAAALGALTSGSSPMRRMVVLVPLGVPHSCWGSVHGSLVAGCSWRERESQSSPASSPFPLGQQWGWRSRSSVGRQPRVVLWTESEDPNP